MNITEEMGEFLALLKRVPPETLPPIVHARVTHLWTRLVAEEQDLYKYKAEATELAALLRRFMNAANSRGRLSPGGCDENTESGHCYAEALEYLASKGYPC